MRASTKFFAFNFAVIAVIVFGYVALMLPQSRSPRDFAISTAMYILFFALGFAIFGREQNAQSKTDESSSTSDSHVKNRTPPSP